MDLCVNLMAFRHRASVHGRVNTKKKSPSRSDRQGKVSLIAAFVSRSWSDAWLYIDQH